jgi:peptidoglycan-associated lipoprotein
MRAILIALSAGAAFGLVFQGCTTTPEAQEPAKVEDKSGGKPAPETRAVDKPKIAAVDVTARDTANVLKDPNNILSKRSLYYDYDKFDVRDEYRALVEAHARYLRENASARILIQGNTDERGSREYNVGLGQRRSDGVKKMLMLLGARENQIESVSLGEEKPQDAGHDESAWAKNRRSDILYNGEY